jgi:hypothetical protein
VDAGAGHPQVRGVAVLQHRAADHLDRAVDQHVPDRARGDRAHRRHHRRQQAAGRPAGDQPAAVERRFDAEGGARLLWWRVAEGGHAVDVGRP